MFAWLEKLPKSYIVLSVFVSMLLYLPVNRFISGGYSLALPVDKTIPLVPIFVIPYLFGLIFWVLTIVAVSLTQDNKVAATFNAKMILASISSVLIYAVIPTYVIRPAVVGYDLFSKFLSFVYSNDRAYNAAPSGHTFYTVLCLITLNRLYPKYKILWIVISLLIILSTLFTKQHNILDVVIGLVFALLINAVGDLNREYSAKTLEQKVQ